MFEQTYINAHMKSKTEIRQKSHLHRPDGDKRPFFIRLQTVKHLEPK